MQALRDSVLYAATLVNLCTFNRADGLVLLFYQVGHYEVVEVDEPESGGTSTVFIPSFNYLYSIVAVVSISSGSGSQQSVSSGSGSLRRDTGQLVTPLLPSPD